MVQERCIRYVLGEVGEDHCFQACIEARYAIEKSD